MLGPEEQNRESPTKVKKPKLDEIREVVSGYLQRRNYPSPDASKTESLTAKEFMVSSSIDSDISRPNSILYSCLNNDPTMIDQTFTKYVSWLKELFKSKREFQDLERLTGPLFCHFYFEILRGDHTERANSFYKLYLPVVDRNHCDKIVLDLINAIDKENSATHFESLKTDFRSKKYILQLSTDSVNALRAFLEDAHIVLLHVLQTWFTIEEIEADVMEDDSCEGTESSQENKPSSTLTNKHTERLLNAINSVKEAPKPIYCINIKNVKDEISCGVLSRSHGVIAYSYNNSISLRSIHTLQQLHSTLTSIEVMLIGHSGRIYDMNIFNNYLISASQDRTIRLYDLSDHLEKIVYYGHDYPIYCLCSSRNNEYFVSGSYDKTARLWSVSQKDCLRFFIGHTQEITSIDFHPNSNYVISGSADKNIKMWAISNAEPVRSFPGSAGNIYAVKFSPDGKYLFSTGEDRKLRVWDLQAGKELRNVDIGAECGIKISVSTDEPHVAVGTIEGCVSIWDFKKLIDESVEAPWIDIPLQPKLLALDYDYGTFGCLSSYEKYSKVIIQSEHLST